ncbi:MAG: flagellar biosynthetic protein FliO [Bacillota bacterium]|nr:flagellar biosynthetic protein FliO [Bacillota bacterium]
MDYSITSSFLRLFVALPVVIILAYISLKIGNKYFKKMNNGRLINVIETVPVFNKAAISVVKIGEEYHVLGVTEANIVDLKTLDEAEIGILNETSKTSNQFDWKSFKGKLVKHD